MPHLAPSECHQHLMKENRPAMSYAGGDVAAWQRKLRTKLRQLVGPWPKKRVPLNTRSIWRKETPLGTIEKIVFTAEAFADVPAYVCIPRKAAPPYTWMICLQGHTTGMHNSIALDADEKNPIVVPGDRDFAIGCMKRGIAALCIEQRSFGQRNESVQKMVSTHGCHDAAMHALMLGRTLIGERVFDVDRGIDYLMTRDDVNRKRIGVMGNSGGVTISLFAAALCSRIQFAMPSCYFCTFADSIMSIYHCSDNYVPGLYPVAEMADVMGLFAPKPVILVAGKTDPIFPLPGVKKAFTHLKKIYRAAGTPGRCHLVVGSQGHRFYARSAWAVAMKELTRLTAD